MNRQARPSKPNRFIRTGAMMFFLWGALHIYAGLLIALPFFETGPAATLAVFGVQFSEPLSHPSLAASHVALNFGFDLAGYGVLAIWLAIYIWRGEQIRRHFAVIAVMLGIADAAFIYSLLLPGYSPLLEGIAGPVLYLLGLMFVGYGLITKQNQPSN